MFIKTKKIYGGSILEYSLVLGVVAMVFMGMNTYVKQGLQAKVKDMTDHFISREQVVEINPTAVTSSLIDDDGRLIPSETRVLSNVISTDQAGGGKRIDSRESTYMHGGSQVIDEGNFTHSGEQDD